MFVALFISQKIKEIRIPFHTRQLTNCLPWRFYKGLVSKSCFNFPESINKTIELSAWKRNSSLFQKIWKWLKKIEKKNFGFDRIRTLNQLIYRPVLFHWATTIYINYGIANKNITKVWPQKSGLSDLKLIYVIGLHDSYLP